MTKYVRDGNLLSHMLSQGVTSLCERKARLIIKTLAQTLSDIHATGIVHRDVKHLNVFVREEGPNLSVKLGDMGLSCRPGQRGTAGTITFMAPEQL